MNTESYVTNLIIAESTNRQKAFWQTMAIQVLAQAEDRDLCPNIYHAIYRAATTNHDRNCDDQDLCIKRGLPFKAHVPNISYISFIQRVMDTASRGIQKVDDYRQKVDHDDVVTLGGTGVDYAMEQGDELGIDASTAATIRLDIEEIHFNLNQVVDLLLDLQALNLWNADPFFMYAPKKPDAQGVWSHTLQSNDWSEVKEFIEFERTEYMNRPMERVATNDALTLVTKSRPDSETKAPRSSEPDAFIDDEVPF